MSTFKQRLHETEDRMTLHMCTIASAAIPQILAANGADGIFVDLEHGGIGYEAAHAMIAATGGSDCAALVRIAENQPALVKRALDLGADGIIFPMIRTAQDAADAVASLHYPPNGTRGFGPFLASAKWQVPLMDYREKVEPQMICILLVETADSVANIEEICKVPGIDMLVPAPFDLSTDLGLHGQFDHPDFLAAAGKIEAAAMAAGIPLGGIGLTQAQTKSLFDRGYRVSVGVDAIWLSSMTREAQSWL